MDGQKRWALWEEPAFCGLTLLENQHFDISLYQVLCKLLHLLLLGRDDELIFVDSHESEDYL